MADFAVTKTTYDHYSIDTLDLEYELTAGGKLNDIPQLINIASKTVPTGYKVKVRIHIDADVEKL
jgi:hypothetical protein